MKSNHPPYEFLKKFVTANLDGPLSCVISAHLDHCKSCRDSTRALEAESANQLLGTSQLETKPELDHAWENIESMLETTTPPPVEQEETETNFIEIGGLKYQLPHPLKRFDGENIKWMPFGKTGKITRVSGENNNSLFLIYLGQNEEVPMHSHHGHEYSYVIAGSFEADGNTFETGDFSLSDKLITHSPKATSADGCLILSCVEDRLNFIQGFMKPLNGILWWFLNFRFRWM